MLLTSEAKLSPISFKTDGKFAKGINNTNGTSNKFTTGVIDIGGKFATSVVNTGGKFSADVIKGAQVWKFSSHGFFLFLHHKASKGRRL